MVSGGKRSTSAADRLDERVPVGVRDVGPPDGAGEEHIAGEERAVREVGDVARRVPRDVERLEGDPAELERLAAVEQDVRLVRLERDLRKPVLGLREDGRLQAGHVALLRRCGSA